MNIVAAAWVLSLLDTCTNSWLLDICLATCNALLSVIMLLNKHPNIFKIKGCNILSYFIEFIDYIHVAEMLIISFTVESETSYSLSKSQGCRHIYMYLIQLAYNLMNKHSFISWHTLLN